MKIVIVGGVAGGASAAARLRRLDEHAEIVLFERGLHISFSNCCLPYYLGGVIKDSDDLLLMSPASFEKRFRVRVYVNSEVVSVDRDAREVTVRRTEDGTTYRESYDKLILATGAAALRPKSIAGADGETVFTVKTVPDVVRLNRYLTETRAKRIAVVGGGFIGLETAENLKKAGYDVILIEGTNQVMAPLDFDMAQILHKELHDHGTDLRLSTTVAAIREGEIETVQNGETQIERVDATVLAIGVAPETDLALQAGLVIGETRGIKVDGCGQTSDPDIYAVGDVTETVSLLTGRPGRVPLAGPAQRQARNAADAILGRKAENHGLLGSSCLKLFDLNVAATGMNEKTATAAGLSFNFAFVLPPDKVGIMPGSHYMAFKLLFECPTGRILGAQAIGKGDVVRRVDVIAALISMGGTLEDLKDLELCYSPVFGTAKDIINLSAMIGLNILSGEMPQVHVSRARELVETGACIIDVREESEYRAGHLKGAKNIPLGQIRSRMAEIPRDVPVYLHCRTSQRSYYALRILQGNGYTNAVNISGSFLGISLYEYYRDLSEKREPILTAYNFH
ncbi:MAG: FAD-dependent oxidoreductase [Clostridia bacterium]|nr:FAD-dependent oxidoreductase [Clostridia bacterium]